LPAYPLAPDVDACESEYLVDETKQVPRAGVDSPKLLPLQLRNRSGDAVGEQFLVAHDRGERSPQLVGHHRQKIRLAVVRSLRFRPRCFRLAPQSLGVGASLLLERRFQVASGRSTSAAPSPTIGRVRTCPSRRTRNQAARRER